MFELEGDWKQWLFLGIYALGGLALVGFVRVLMCPPGGSTRVVGCSAVLIGLVGGSVVMLAFYALYLDEQVHR